MTDTLNGRRWVEIVLAMDRAIEANSAALSKLDSTIGDGDHGASLAKAMNAAGEQVSILADPTPAMVLQTSGFALINTMGGASGIIFGSFYLGMAQEFDEATDISTDQLAAGMAAGLKQVQKRGKAEPGGKTMLDALAPATAAVATAAREGVSLQTAIRAAADAAQAGAEATREMVALYGRAKYLGERSLGYQDAGATSLALMLLAFSDCILASESLASTLPLGDTKWEN